ncbi:helicase HerA-like domain-containing protein [Pseudoxanthomonas kaohsiungensis]|uniref:ATP-binding protein n=1 Tax=Pseudoxanthomonas kaohsiungensis TaxID=283923 RepID=A0ABW3LZY1_9GAMM
MLGDGEGALHVPFWALPAVEILRIFAGGTGGATFLGRFVELVGKYRKQFVTASAWLKMDASAVTPDTPVPFDINLVWFELDSENRETLTVKADPTTRAVVNLGDASALRSTVFSPYGAGAAAPFKGAMYGVHGTMPDLLRLGLRDPRLQFLLKPKATFAGPDPMVHAIIEWLGRDKPIAVLDFSGVPPEAADAAIGVVLSLILQVAMRAPDGDQAIGKNLPVLLVLEEAHRYLSEGASMLTRESANKIAREGRKYGVGMWLVSQRPTELPETALAQCGTLIALRLTNSADQGAVKTALPDDVSGLSAVLPALRTGEALVSGEAAVIPTRTVLDVPSPFPKAEDPSLAGWRKDLKEFQVDQAISSWRGTYGEE